MEPQNRFFGQGKRRLRITYGLAGALTGGLLLCAFSMMQKSMIDAPIFVLRGYIVPAVFGSLSGLIIAALYYQQVKNFEDIRLSQIRYHNLFEGLPIGSCQVSHTGYILAANAAAECLLCCIDRKSLLAMHLGDFFVDPGVFQAFWTSLQRDKKIASQDIHFQACDGTPLWVQIQGQIAETDHDPFPTYTISLLDITLQKRLQEQLIKLRQAVLTSQEVIFMTDPDGVIVFINPTFTQLYGYEAGEVIDQVTPRILKSGRMAAEEYTNLWERLLEKQTVSNEFINKTKNDRFLYIESSASPILDDEDQIIGFLAIQRDVSDRKQDQEALERHARRLEMMRNIDRAILRETSPETIAAAALEAAEGLLPFLRISIATFDFEVNRFHVLAARARGGTELSAGRQGDLDKFGIDLSQLRRNRINIVEDIDQLEALTEVTGQLKKEGIRSFINIAMMIKDDLIGSLNLANDAPHTYSAEELSILQDVAAQLALAIHQAQLRQRNDRQRRKLATLLEISQALATTIDLDQVLQLSIEQAVRAMRLETGAIYLLENETLTLGATTPPLPPEAPGVVYVAQLCDHPHINQAISTGKPVYLPDAIGAIADLSPQERKISEARGLRSQLFVPLPVGSQMVGVLIVGTVSRVQKLSPTITELAQTFSAQIALAVENARLHDRLKRHADQLEDTVAKRTEELRAANKELEALSSIKDEFVSNVSHELRTPITSIKLYHTMLQKRTDKQREYHQKLGRELDRLTLLIENLLRLSRFDQGYVDLDLHPVDLNLLAEQYVEDRRIIAREHGLGLKLVEASGPVFVRADMGILGQALSILLTNAFNYTPAGGEIEVQIESCPQDGRTWGEIHVSDTGLGISPEEASFVFDRFYRGAAGRQSKTSGTGLGLSIAREIVERHDGRIEVISPGRLGPGTTFSICLPALDKEKDNPPD